MPGGTGGRPIVTCEGAGGRPILTCGGGVVLTKLLLNDLENLLLVKLLRETLDGGQGLASISLCCTFVLAMWSDFPSASHRPMRARASALTPQLSGGTYAGFVCECSFGSASFHQCLRRPRRRDLYIGIGSVNLFFASSHITLNVGTRMYQHEWASHLRAPYRRHCVLPQARQRRDANARGKGDDVFKSRKDRMQTPRERRRWSAGRMFAMWSFWSPPRHMRRLLQVPASL